MLFSAVIAPIIIVAAVFLISKKTLAKKIISIKPVGYLGLIMGLVGIQLDDLLNTK